MSENLRGWLNISQFGHPNVLILFRKRFPFHFDRFTHRNVAFKVQPFAKFISKDMLQWIARVRSAWKELSQKEFHRARLLLMVELGLGFIIVVLMLLAIRIFFF